MKNRLLDLLLNDALAPRFHAGVGFAQVYLPSGARLHVWHPALPVEPEAFGCRHNHRFDMTSTVLKGALIHTPFYLVPSRKGAFQRFTVLAAHHGVAETPVPLIPQRYEIMIERPRVLREGTTYQFDKRAYHETRAHGLTVTLMVKSAQEDFRAEIVAPFDQPPRHGLDHEVSDGALRVALLEAFAALSEEALALIEPHLEPAA